MNFPKDFHKFTEKGLQILEIVQSSLLRLYVLIFVVTPNPDTIN